MAEKLIIPGGSGFLGRTVARWFSRQGWEIVVLSRRNAAVPGARVVLWDAVSPGAWSAEIEGADAVLNLAGRSVNCRYHKANRREILDSRVVSTRVLGEVLAASRNPPPVWLNSSSATIYRHAEERPMDEAGGELGEGFSVEVCKAWERTLFEARTPHVRRVAMRTAMVMGIEPGGPYEVFRRLAKWGLGGAMGPGTQYVSWLHEEDFCRSIEWLIAHGEIEGAINLASPNPLPNREFMRHLRTAVGCPVGLPAVRWMLELGAIFLRTETELPLKSRRVVPGRMLSAGCTFSHPRWPEAAHELESRARS
jgi:hypothetical protein